MPFLSEEHTANNPKYPDVNVQLSGEEGNIFSIMGRISKAMQRAGYEKFERDEFTQTMMNCSSFDEALHVAMRTVNTH